MFASWLLTVWFLKSKPKSVCLRENTALGLHRAQQTLVLQRPSKQLLSYDRIPNERSCVLSRVIIWPFESRPWPPSGMRKLLLLINSDTAMSTSADLVKKKFGQNRPVFHNNPRDFSPQTRSESRLHGSFQRTLHQSHFTACLRRLWPQSVWVRFYIFACKGSKPLVFILFYFFVGGCGGTVWFLKRVAVTGKHVYVTSGMTAF